MLLWQGCDVLTILLGEIMPKLEKKEASTANRSAEKLTPDETQPVRRRAGGVAGLILGEYVWLTPVAGRLIRNPIGGYYDLGGYYHLLITKTLLQQIKHVDWALSVDPATLGG